VDVRAGFQAVIAQLTDLQAGQELILGELTIQRNMLERVSAIRDDLAHFQQPPDDDQTDQYTRLLDQLHRVVQGAKIQLASWQASREQVRTNLSEDVFRGLSPSAEHFLVTAEVFFHASQDISPQIDAGLISVEYAKVVEVELRDGLLTALGRHLDQQKYRGRLFGAEEIHKSGRLTWEHTLSGVGLGTTANLLDKAATGGENEAVMNFIEELGFDRAWVRKLSDEVRLISNHYRNGAAHTKPLSHDDLVAFRTLLFDGTLLRRLVELSRCTQRAV
jgi:hypothetical protein